MPNESFLHEIQGAGALDFAGDLAMKLRGDTSRAAGINLAGLGRELLHESGIEVVHILERHVETATWHLAVCAAKVHRTLFCFRSNHRIVWLRLPGPGSALLAMKSAALEVGIKLHFFQSTGSPKALLV